MTQEFTPWIERKFGFDYPVEDYRQLITRLESIPARLEAVLKSAPCKLLTIKIGDKWSIQENAGHFINTEKLFQGRLDDFENGAEVLRAADMSNRPTGEADYNARQLDEILSEFRAVRGSYIERLRGYPPEMFARKSFHLRLKTPMRLVDSLFFQAEHDDHHLETIRRLIESLR